MDLLTGADLSLLAYAGIFLGVLMAFDGLRQLISRSESLGEARNRRMRMIARGAKTEDVLRLLKPDEHRWTIAGLPFLGTLGPDLQKAGLTIAPGLFVALSLGAGLVTALAASTVLPAPAAAALAILTCVLMPRIWVAQRRKARMNQLLHQLPDALDLMARGLRVGHPLNATIAAVAADMNDPVATEFGLMVDQVSYGDELTDAFRDFADRTGLEDTEYLAVSVGIQHGTGGDLAQILNTLAQVIRDRATMRRRIRAISAEGRLTSYFLSALPLVIVASTSITAPGYYAGVVDDPAFRPVALVVLLLVVANWLVLRRLVSFRF